MKEFLENLHNILVGEPYQYCRVSRQTRGY